MLQLLRKQNSGGRTLTWSLPAGKTCPAAGECRKWCYASTKCYNFPSTKKAHQRNLDRTKQNKWTFTADMVNWLWRRKKKPKYVRIHSSGDFYNQHYLDQWTAVATLNSDIVFYCYTKSLHLDWSKFDALENTVRIASLGGKHDSKIGSLPMHKIMPVCRVAQDDDELEQLLAEGWIDGSHDDYIAASGLVDRIVLRKH